MRKIHMLAAALAGVFLALPALAAPNLAGTTWEDDVCMMAFEFSADSSFFFEDYLNAKESLGHWRIEAGILHLQHERGESIQTQISDNLFELDYLNSEGKRYTCQFEPVVD